MFFKAILLKTAGFGALQNLLSKAEDFRDSREIHGLKFESSKETSILPVATVHSANGSGEEASKNFGAKFFGFPEFCFWKLFVFEIWKVFEVQKNTPWFARRLIYKSVSPHDILIF